MMKNLFLLVLLLAATLPVHSAPNKTHKTPLKITSNQAKYQRAMAAFARDDVREEKREAKLNARIPKKRRQMIYYQLQQAITDNILNNKSMTGDPYMKVVCRQNHISDDDAGTIRTEGDKQGWPQPEM